MATIIITIHKAKLIFLKILVWYYSYKSEWQVNKSPSRSNTGMGMTKIHTVILLLLISWEWRKIGAIVCAMVHKGKKMELNKIKNCYQELHLFMLAKK